MYVPFQPPPSPHCRFGWIESFCLVVIQLFFIDDGAAPSSKNAAPTDTIVYDETSHIPSYRSENEDEDDGDGEEGVEEADHSSHSSESESETAPVLITDQATPPGEAPRLRKAPAWTDPDDANLKISLTAHHRLRKLRDGPSEDTVTGREYERKLRRQFERIHPTPEWATKARKKQQSKRRRSSLSGSDVDEGVEDILPDLLASTGGISAEKKSNVLTQGVISIERLRDANQAATAEGEIKSVQFHPSPQIPVLLTASVDRRLRLFHVRFQFPFPSFAFHACASPRSLSG